MEIKREVWIGGKTKDELFTEMMSKKIGVNTSCLKILNSPHFTTSLERKKLETIEVSLTDMGFSNGATTDGVYKRARELKLKLCPVELGPHLRLQYIDFNQPIDPMKGNWLNIAIEKISKDKDFPNGFYLRRMEDGFWLRGYHANPEYLWDLNDRFIFCK